MTLLASQVIAKPVISEKSMDQTQHSRYTFRVHPDANRLMVKQAIEELFKVQVTKVNVLNSKAKEKSRNRGRSRIRGWTTPWKKAIVTLAEGQKIEFFEGV